MSDSTDSEAIRTGLSKIWARSKPIAANRARLIADAIQRISSGERGESVVEEHAHKLAGSLGTFGLSVASGAARAIELELQKSEPSIEQLRALSAKLTQAIDGHDGAEA